MVTIVIADDEKLIRAGISKILRDSIDLPLEIFEAKNGQEALVLCKEEHPNILITDIRMPIMDGVELMKSVSILENKPKIIVLSGFDDFIYAKAAIQNGASSYILKPLDKMELISSVENAISDYRKNERKRNEETLQTIIKEGRINSDLEITSKSFKNGYYCLYLNGQYCKNFIESLFNAVDYYLLESKKNLECLIIPREAIYLIEESKEALNYIIGLSNVSDSISSLRTVKKQAFLALLESFYSTGDTEQSKSAGIYYFEHIPQDVEFSRLDDMYERYMSRLSISTTEEIQKGINKIFDAINENVQEAPVKLEYIYNKILTNLFTKFPAYSENDLYLHLKSIMIENLWDFKNLQEWKTCVTDYTIYISELLKQNTVEYPFVEEALKYLKENFRKNINMAMVANQVSVNYTWFSEKFKEHTGMNFNEYIKKLRIEEACSLLEKGCYKVYEVSEKSGFGDVKYFMKTFKECTGVSPGEWKKLHTQ